MKELQQNVTARICKGIRAFLGWDQSRLAEKASIGIATVQSVEKENAERATNPSTITSIKVAFEENGVKVSYDQEKDEVTVVYKLNNH